MITLKIDSESFSEINLTYIHELVGFYRGTMNFSGAGVISILPKPDFNLDGLLMTLRSTGIKVEKI